MSNTEIPKQDRLLLVLDTSTDLWDLVIDAFGAHDCVEFVIVTDAFLQLLNPKQTRELLVGIAALSRLRIVQIDFPLPDTTVSTTSTDGKFGDDDSSIRLNNIDRIHTSKEFAVACENHPSLKDIQVVSGDEGLKRSYRRKLSLVVEEKLDLKHDDDDNDQQSNGTFDDDINKALMAHASRRVSRTMGRAEQGRRPMPRTSLPVNTAPDYEKMKRRLRKAISKDKRSPSPEPVYTGKTSRDRRHRTTRATRSVSPPERKDHRHSHKRLEKRISRSHSPRSRHHRNHEEERSKHQSRLSKTHPEKDENGKTRSHHRSKETPR